MFKVWLTQYISQDLHLSLIFYYVSFQVTEVLFVNRKYYEKKREYFGSMRQSDFLPVTCQQCMTRSYAMVAS